MNLEKLSSFKNELKDYAENSLLPFWANNCKDSVFGGYNSHFSLKNSQ